MNQRFRHVLRPATLLLTVWGCCLWASAQEPQSRAVGRPRQESPSSDVIAPEQWQRVDGAVDRALAWLAARQNADGSFPTIPNGQPGVTSLCVMAFLVQGHTPGEGIYGKQIERAADYVMRCQKENGLVALQAPASPYLNRVMPAGVGETAFYNHAISSLMLSELYGMSEAPESDRLRLAIVQALAVTLETQRWPKDHPEDRNGWRYANDVSDMDSDLSVTGWQLMFLRSARNAGFAVPAESIDEAVAYMRRCYNKSEGVFCYASSQTARSRGMAGAGVLAMAHAGYHNSTEAASSGAWVLRHGFDNYNEATNYSGIWSNDRYHYGLFNCCQGMYQLGGSYWEEFFPRVVDTLLANQQRDGAWPAEKVRRDAQYGNAYTTALAVLSLGASNELLPIFQR